MNFFIKTHVVIHALSQKTDRDHKQRIQIYNSKATSYQKVKCLDTTELETTRSLQIN